MLRAGATGYFSAFTRIMLRRFRQPNAS